LSFAKEISKKHKTCLLKRIATFLITKENGDPLSVKNTFSFPQLIILYVKKLKFRIQAVRLLCFIVDYFKEGITSILEATEGKENALHPQVLFSHLIVLLDTQMSSLEKAEGDLAEKRKCLIRETIILFSLFCSYLLEHAKVVAVPSVYHNLLIVLTKLSRQGKQLSVHKEAAIITKFFTKGKG